MLNAALTVARKELVDHLRDARALVSVGLYSLMGPVVVWLVVAMTSASSTNPAVGAAIVPVMAAVFTLVGAFTGSMSVSMDMIAGERERQSLLPLLVNSVPRSRLIVGKWLAASVFASLGLAATLGGFLAVLAMSGSPTASSASILPAVPALIALACLAAAVEIAVSALCRSGKEANTYLSLLMFGVMGVGMWLAFRPEPASSWWFILPVLGHERLLELGFAGDQLSFFECAGLGMTSFAVAGAAVVAACGLFQRDAVIYGN